MSKSRPRITRSADVTTVHTPTDCQLVGRRDVEHDASVVPLLQASPAVPSLPSLPRYVGFSLGPHLDGWRRRGIVLRLNRLLLLLLSVALNVTTGCLSTAASSTKYGSCAHSADTHSAPSTPLYTAESLAVSRSCVLVRRENVSYTRWRSLGESLDHGRLWLDVRLISSDRIRGAPHVTLPSTSVSGMSIDSR